MSESKHTQLPWRFGRTDMSESIMIVDNHDNYVAAVRIRQTGGGAISAAMEGPRRSNAEFIVRACNSHDELLEACKAVIEWWEEHEYDTAGSGVEEYNLYDDEPEMVTLARKTIEQAEKGTE